MTSIIPDSAQDTAHDTFAHGSQDRILLKAVTIELSKPRHLNSTISVTLGDRRETKPSGRGKYARVNWEPDEAWEISAGGVLEVLWRSRCPFKRSRKMVIDRDTLLSITCNQSATEYDPDGTLEYVAFRDKGHKISVKFSLLEGFRPQCGLSPLPGPVLQPEPQPKIPPESEIQSKLQPKPHYEPHLEPQPETQASSQAESQVEPQLDPFTESVKRAVEEAVKVKSVRDRLGDSITYLEGLLSLGDVVKDIHPIIGVSIGLLSGVLRILEVEDKLNRKIAELIISMSEVAVYIVDVKQFATMAQLKAVMKEANGLICRAVNIFNKHKESSILTRVFSAFSQKTQEELEGIQADLTRFKNVFDRGISVQTMIAADKLDYRLKVFEKLLMELVRANGDDKTLENLDTKHQTRALRCLDGTRRDLIALILEWARDFTASTLNILWIYGYPGAGKSTLAMHVADILRASHRLGVVVEFNRTTGVNAVVLWKTFAYALAYEYPECRDVIVSILKSRTLNLANATSSQIFEHLVAEPLRRLISANPRISQGRRPVLIIDALDECGSLDGPLDKNARKELLACLSDWAKLPPGVKLIVTSRVEQDIEVAFSNFPHKKLHVPTGASVPETSQSAQDMQLYLKTGFKEIASINGIANDWPGDEIILDLTRRAQGLFIWATTVLSFVDGLEPQHQLNMILDGPFPAGNIYALYRQILDTSFPHTYNAETFVVVVGAVITMQKQFTPKELAQLLEIDPVTINGVRKGLRTVLDDTDVMRFRHQSFVDFLTNVSMKLNDPLTENLTVCPKRFHIDVSAAHGHVCNSLFRVMNKELRFNICQTPSSFMYNDSPYQNEETIGRVLSYACRLWGFHLTNAQSGLEVNSVHTFIHDNFLSWLEGLSGLQSLISAVPSLTTLEEWLQSSHEQSTSLIALVKDAITFIQYFAQAIADSAPHVYISALAFAPKSSIISQLYAPIFKNIIRVVVGRLDGWPAEQAVIRGHTHSVNFVTFSPNGKRIVSCSCDKTIRISNVETGEMVSGPFKEHNDDVLRAVHSTDGKNVLSVSKDNTIRMWDAECGVVNGPVNHETVIVDGIGDCVSFSHNRKYVASAQSEYTTIDGRTIANVIIVRDVVTGQIVTGPIGGHEDRINCVAFSPDDTCVASGSDDGTIRVWDRQTGELVAKPLEGSQHRVSSISFSYNGTLVVSGASDGIIRLWEVTKTLHQVRVYEGHNDWVRCVAFSSDDRWIVSGSDDCTCRVWNVKTGQVAAGPFQGHTNWVISVAFSPDCKRIVSGSEDSTVRIWKVEVDAKSETLFDGHEGGIHSIALSKDDKYIVSGSEDKTIRIWDWGTGELVQGPLKGHKAVVYSVAYSPNGQRVVSGSADKTIRVWDVAQGETAMVLRGHNGEVCSVAYSNNGRYIASASWGGRNRIWDAETGHCIHILQVGDGFRDRPSIAFSPDGELIASNSFFGFRIWGVETGNMTIESGVPDVYSVAFSHDGKLVATGSENGDIHVWNVTTGQLVFGPFTGHTSWVYSIAFSPDDNFIISGSSDTTVRLWDTKTGQPAIGPFNGHTSTVSSVAFSYNGNFVVSASFDGAIRVWSTEQKRQPLFTSESTVGDDGWVKEKGNQLLFWTPPCHRLCLHRPNNTRIIGPNETQIDFGNVRWGEDWIQCYTP